MRAENAYIILGGSFDPVHQAHITLAHALNQVLQLPIRFLPAYRSPLKQQTHTNNEQRLTMLSLAVREYPQLMIDTRELANPTASYTIDTLRAYRQEIGEQTPLIFIMGQDSFNSLPQWKEWQQLLTLCHIIVADRPEYDMQGNEITEKLYQNHKIEEITDLLSTAYGKIAYYPFTAWPIASTTIREQLAQGQRPEGLPDAVWQYINTQKLYVTQQ